MNKARPENFSIISGARTMLDYFVNLREKNLKDLIQTFPELAARPDGTEVLKATFDSVQRFFGDNLDLYLILNNFCMCILPDVKFVNPDAAGHLEKALKKIRCRIELSGNLEILGRMAVRPPQCSPANHATYTL